MPWVIRKWSPHHTSGTGWVYFNGHGWAWDRRCAVRFDQALARGTVKLLRRLGRHKGWTSEFKPCPSCHRDARVVRLRRPARHVCTEKCTKGAEPQPGHWVGFSYRRGAKG